MRTGKEMTDKQKKHDDPVEKLNIDLQRYASH